MKKLLAVLTVLAFLLFSPRAEAEQSPAPTTGDLSLMLQAAVDGDAERGTQNKLGDLGIVRHPVHADRKRVDRSAELERAQDHVRIDVRMKPLPDPRKIRSKALIHPPVRRFDLRPPCLSARKKGRRPPGLRL